MKRRSVQSRKRRDRKSSRAPYTKYQKVSYKYPFLTGPGSWEKRHRFEFEDGPK